MTKTASALCLLNFHNKNMFLQGFFKMQSGMLCTQLFARSLRRLAASETTNVI